MCQTLALWLANIFANRIAAFSLIERPSRISCGEPYVAARAQYMLRCNNYMIVQFLVLSPREDFTPSTRLFQGLGRFDRQCLPGELCAPPGPREAGRGGNLDVRQSLRGVPLLS